MAEFRCVKSEDLPDFRLTVEALLPKLLTAGNRRSMALFAHDKEKERFYLLPGMGGRNLRRKRRVILQWSIVAGIFTSAVLAVLLYLISKNR
jgi:hypothetical protein